MSLPHRDRSRPSPWAEWPANMPEPVAVRSIEEVGDEVREVYRITMPNGATAESWTVTNSWDDDGEYGFAGDWNPYGLRYDEHLGLLMGNGSDKVYETIEEWARQDRGKACASCRCSGQVITFLFATIHDGWQTCPTCRGTGWIPHPPESLSPAP